MSDQGTPNMTDKENSCQTDSSSQLQQLSPSTTEDMAPKAVEENKDPTGGGTEEPLPDDDEKDSGEDDGDEEKMDQTKKKGSGNTAEKDMPSGDEKIPTDDNGPTSGVAKEAETKEIEGSTNEDPASEAAEEVEAEEPAPEDDAINAEEDEEETIDLNQPIKKARTAFFIFREEKWPQVQKEHQGGGVAVWGKVLGELWRNLSDAEKQSYEEKSAKERARVLAAKKKQKEKGIEFDPPPSAGGGGGAVDPTSPAFPLARIRKITKLDPDVNNITKEGLALITKATELSLIRLGKEAVKVAAMQNRRKLRPEDVVMVTKTHNEFAFLKDDLKDLVEEQVAEAAKKAAEKESEDAQNSGTGEPTRKRKAENALPVQSNKLTSYFSMKPRGGGDDN